MALAGRNTPALTQCVQATARQARVREDRLGSCLMEYEALGQLPAPHIALIGVVRGAQVEVLQCRAEDSYRVIC